MSCLYSITEAENIISTKISLFILGSGSDERTLSMMNLISAKQKCISYILLIKYDSFDESTIIAAFPYSKLEVIDANSNQISFLNSLSKYQCTFKSDSILVDITSIRIPEMFILFKYLQYNNPKAQLHVAYSSPIEYEFPEEPFTSYHSYYGNLNTTDVLGYSGISDDMSQNQMIIFLGFEGVLSEKVNEDVQYSVLKLVNNLPSFYEKYKDISIINNYNLLATGQDKLYFVPANNPFETYNFLSKQISENETVCIAPLSTKPVALGVCLYALHHESVRVVYPMAERYMSHRANSVHKTYIYTIGLDRMNPLP